MKNLISVLCLSSVVILFSGCSKETNEQPHASSVTTASDVSASEQKH